ncbi:MFS transporter [Alkalihalophilus pseudofirmus]|uniref:MFS transporter n=1 Tax=Alkalihalophilus pseudofirmus TaxID=79885 RepID=UPI000952B607|nr:MFS transporter [Alkalihalophilus pseudofirmus]
MIIRFIQQLYYGWIVVFISAFAVFLSGPGQTYSNSVYIDEYIHYFGWSRSEISGIYSVATLFAGMLMIIIGRFVDRLGQKQMMMIVGTVLGLACFFNSFVSNIWMMAVGFFLIRLFGQGSMTLIPATLVPQWFIKKRGRALSFMAIGSFVSAAFFPIANTWMINTWSWQTSWQVWGSVLLFVFVPLVVVGVKNKPEDIGLLPDGALNQPTSTKPKKEDSFITEVDWTLKEAMRTKSFWFILICVAIPALVNTGITFHLLSIFGENQLTPQLAATILSMMAIVGFPISMVAGFILEKVRTNLLLALIFVLEIVLLVILLFTNNVWMAVLFGLIWGTANGLERITLNIVWPNYFGRKYLGSIKGVAVTVMVIGSSLGPLPFGIGFDLFSSYTQILLLVSILPIAGIVFALLAKKPAKAHEQLASHIN